MSHSFDLERLESPVPGDLPAAETSDVRSPARRQLLTLAAFAGGAVFAGAVFQPARADLLAKLSRVVDLDTTILNFAHELEELEADFFSRVSSSRGWDELEARERNLLNQFAAQDRIHFEILSAARGPFLARGAGSFETPNQVSSRRPRFFKYPSLQTRDEVLKASLDLKENALFAYHGAVGLLDSKELLAVAVSIAGVEGRHVAVLRELIALDPVPAPFGGALEAQISGRKLARYGFQGGAPR